MSNRGRLIEKGWRQGALVPPNSDGLTKNALHDIPDDSLLLIVSQTCDLINGSFDDEPYFEVLCIHPLDREPQKAYLGGKNSRRIEFSTKDKHDTEKHWYAIPHERHLIDRHLLLGDLSPGEHLDDDLKLKMVLRWLARRYTRTAFPENFVGRMRTRQEQIGKKFSRLNPLISSIYIRLSSPEELEENEDYKIELILVMSAINYDDQEKYDLCAEIKDQLEHQLNGCRGIAVDDISIESTASITIEDLKGFLDWDYSYLSFRDEDGSPLPIDVE